ncbi:MAG: enoyl-CoA hydratase/isomerase family protein [Flavobacterium sp.]
MNSQGQISVTKNNAVAFLSFFHPQSNSFPSVLLQELTTEINTLAQDDSVNVIVLRSEGNGAFCAGASFDELLNIETLEQGKQFFSGFANVINAMRKCSKIIVGRVQGKAVGGGVGLASACDYVFATSASAVKLSEIAIGIGPFVIEPAVSRKIGKTAVAELSLNPTEWKSAQWAKEKGLYANVFENTEEMDAGLDKFANSLATYSQEALTEMKKVLWDGTENWDSLLYERAEISGRLVLSDFTKNALQKFKNK